MNKTLTFLLTTVLLLTAAQLHAQLRQLVKKRSFHGRPVGGFTIDSRAEIGEFALDLDGDGTVDFTIFHLDESTPKLRVRGSADGTEYAFPLAGINADPKNLRLIGFVDVWEHAAGKISPAMPRRQAVLGVVGTTDLFDWVKASVVSQTGVEFQFEERYRLLDIRDFDEDGLADFLVGDPENKVVEIWGAQQ